MRRVARADITLGARRFITFLSAPKVFLTALDDEPTPSGNCGEEFPED